MHPAPTIAIVTINLNRADEVGRTCRSILGQEIPGGFTWIVIDGGSTDGSLEILQSNLRPGDVLVSERDSGIADAMNKGLSRVTADAVLFMNAGDEFAGPDSLAGLVRAWDRSRHRWIIGAADVVAADGRLLFRRAWDSTPTDPTTLVRRNCQIIHQAVLADRSLFVDHGPFDTSFRIAMDYELWLRWISRGAFPQTTAHPVCRFHRGGASGDPQRNHRENTRARQLHGIGNGIVGEYLLGRLAWLKGRIRGRYGAGLYRWKERLGVRI